MRPSPRIPLSIAALPLLALAATNPHESDFTVWGGRQFLTRPVVDVFAGEGQVVALQDDGTLVSWGLGSWTTMPANLPPLRKVVPNAGGTGSLGIRASDSAVIHWGYSSNMLPTDTFPALDVEFGAWGSFSVGVDGSVTEWGLRGPSKLPGLDHVVRIAANWNHGIALRSDGTILPLRASDSLHKPPAGMGPAQSIAVGAYHSAALLRDGTVQVWGRTAGKRLGVPDGLANALAIRAGGDAMAALLADSTVVAWGTNSYLSTDSVVRLGKARAFSVGGGHVAVVRPDATVEVFAGGNFLEQTRVTRGFRGAKAFSASKLQTTVLHEDGTVSVYGSIPANGGPPEDLSRVVRIHQSDEIALAVRSDGTVAVWPAGTILAASIPPLGGVADAQAGVSHVLVLFTDGTLAAYGENRSGQLEIPSGLLRAKAIAVGYEHNLALLENDSVVGWGDTTHFLRRIPAHGRAVAIAAGRYHGLILQEDGRVVAWGDTLNHADRVPSGLDSVVAIAAGAFHSIALRSNGKVVVWGDTGAFQTIVPRDLPTVKAVFGGYDCTMALHGDPRTLPIGASGDRTTSPVPGDYPARLYDLGGRRIWEGTASWNGASWKTSWKGSGTAILRCDTPSGEPARKIFRP